MPKSLTEQIEELIGEEINVKEDDISCDYSGGLLEGNMNGFNQARTEIINKIPEIFSLIRGEVKVLKLTRLGLSKKMKDDTYQDRLDINRDISIHNQTIKQVLEKLK